MSGSADDLARVREEIDALDTELLERIVRRAQCALRVAELKRAADDGEPFYRPEREARILRRLLDANPGPLDDAALARLLREIVSTCRSLEARVNVGYLGPLGSFTGEAARKHFGHAVELTGLRDAEEVFQRVEAGALDYGVVPVENSTEGAVNRTLDCLARSPLHIVGEIEMRIHQCLMGRGAAPARAAAPALYAHPQSMAQCRAWLAANLPNCRHVACESNSEAAERAATEDGAVALGAAGAAAIYGLEVLCANIEDRPDNTTRFLALGRHRVPPSGRDKTSIVVSARNRPGALLDLLRPLAGVDLTRVESRPANGGKWRYVFFLDIEGHCDEEPLAGALEKLRETAELCKWLGSYPRALP